MFPVVRTLLFGGVSGKILGVSREVVSAWLFGTGAVAAAFRVSNTAFTLPLQSFVSEALNGGFIPQYALHRRDDLRAGALLFASMHALLLVTSTIVGITVFVSAAWWIRLLAPALDANTIDLAVQMVRVMAIAMPPYLATALYAAADLAHGNGRLSAMRASVQNVGVLSGTIAAWLFGQPWMIAGGFAVAYFALAAWGLRISLSNDVALWPGPGELGAVRTSLLKVWRRCRMLIGIPIALQLHFIVERRTASMLGETAVVAVDYARFISETSVTLLAMPFALAGLGAMAVMTPEIFRKKSAESIRILLYVGIPMASILVGNSKTIVQLIFERGAFASDSTTTTAAIVAGLGIGVWAQLVAFAGAKFLCARGDNRFVMMTTVAGLTVNVLANLLFASHLGVAVLGLSTAANSVVYFYLITRRIGVLGELRAELVGLLVAAMTYLVISSLMFRFAVPPLLILLVAVPFWAVALMATARQRATFRKVFGTFWQ